MKSVVCYSFCCSRFRCLVGHCRVLRLSSVKATTAATWQTINADHVKSHYALLGVDDTCSNEEVKEAFLRLAKQYHPDSGTQFSDANKFMHIEEAYRSIIAHRKETGKASKDLQEIVFDIKHTAPQHRQYLSFEGVGYGTPFQRQRQYQQSKVMKAVDSVYDYRTQKVSALYENSMVTKDKAETRKRTIGNTLDRLVEDLIQESMAKGDFDNLPGSGKPLPLTDHNPYIDTMTHNINKILINNGYVPEWVTLEKEIRQCLSQAKEDLLKTRIYAGKEPISFNSNQRLSKKIDEFRETIASINLKINKLNMLVPTLRQQMFHFDANREIENVLKQHDDIKYEEMNYQQQENTQLNSVRSENSVTLYSILKELKALFSAS